MKIKTIDKDIVLDTIRELLDTFTKQSKLPMLAPKQISKELSSAIQYEHNRYRIVLGTKDLSSYKYNKQIPEQLFVEKMISCFHEDRHLQQQFAFRVCFRNFRNIHIVIPFKHLYKMKIDY